MKLYHAQYKFICEWDVQILGSIFLKHEPRHKIEVVEFEVEDVKAGTYK